MRQILLAAIVLGGLLATADPASAQNALGYRRSLGWWGPYYVQPYPFYGVSAYPIVPFPSYPVVPPYYYGGSYFRPDAPIAWNAQRNWRDTWQDDGVKVHGYTFR
jgi:hypothetical protein